MLEIIISSLVSVVDSLNYFEKIIPLVEYKNAGGSDKKMLHEYVGKGQYKPISNLDNYNGVVYFRRNGNVNTGVNTAAAIVPCDDPTEFNYPLRFVCAIKRNQLPCDNQFSDDKLSVDLVGKFMSQNSPLKNSLGASFAEVIPSRVVLNRDEILRDEYPELKLKDIDYQMTYLAIDLNVRVVIKKSCLKSLCENVY